MSDDFSQLSYSHLTTVKTSFLWKFGKFFSKMGKFERSGEQKRSIFWIFLKKCLKMTHPLFTTATTQKTHVNSSTFFVLKKAAFYWSSLSPFFKKFSSKYLSFSIKKYLMCKNFLGKTFQTVKKHFFIKMTQLVFGILKFFFQKFFYLKYFFIEKLRYFE